MKIGENSFGRYFKGLDTKDFGLESETLKDTSYYLVYLTEKEQAKHPEEDWAYVISNYTLAALFNAPEMWLVRKLQSNRRDAYNPQYTETLFRALGNEFVISLNFPEKNRLLFDGNHLSCNTEVLFSEDNDLAAKDKLIIDLCDQSIGALLDQCEEPYTKENIERFRSYLNNELIDNGITGTNGEKYVFLWQSGKMRKNHVYIMGKESVRNAVNTQVFGSANVASIAMFHPEEYSRKLSEYWDSMEKQDFFRGYPVNSSDIKSLDSFKKCLADLKELFYRITMDDLAISNRLLQNLMEVAHFYDNPFDGLSWINSAIEKTIENDIHVEPLTRFFGGYYSDIWYHGPKEEYVEMIYVCDTYFKSDRSQSFESFIKGFSKEREEIFEKETQRITLESELW